MGDGIDRFAWRQGSAESDGRIGCGIGREANIGHRESIERMMEGVEWKDQEKAAELLAEKPGAKSRLRRLLEVVSEEDRARLCEIAMLLGVPICPVKMGECPVELACAEGYGEEVPNGRDGRACA